MFHSISGIICGPGTALTLKTLPGQQFMTYCSLQMQINLVPQLSENLVKNLINIYFLNSANLRTSLANKQSSIDFGMLGLLQLL